MNAGHCQSRIWGCTALSLDVGTAVGSLCKNVVPQTLFSSVSLNAKIHGRQCLLTAVGPYSSANYADTRTALVCVQHRPTTHSWSPLTRSIAQDATAPPSPRSDKMNATIPTGETSPTDPGAQDERVATSIAPGTAGVMGSFGLRLTEWEPSTRAPLEDRQETARLGARGVSAAAVEGASGAGTRILGGQMADLGTTVNELRQDIEQATLVDWEPKATDETGLFLEHLQREHSFQRAIIAYGKQLGKKGGEVIGAVLCDNSTISTLDLGYNKLGAKGCAAIARGLARNTTVANVDVNDNGAGDEGATAFGEALARNSSLRCLDIYSNGITSVGGIALLAGVSSCSTLTSLDLSSNSIGESGATALADAIAVNTSLRCIDASACRIGPGGAAAIARALRVNKTLTKLVLGSNGISDEGTREITKSLGRRRNSTLHTLKLPLNGLSAEGAGFVAAMLLQNSTLSRLDLSYNGIGDEGCEELATALQLNTHLTNLDLSRNRIGVEGAESLAAAIGVNSVLKVLKLQHNVAIGDVGASYFATALSEGDSSLARLGLGGSCVGQGWQSKIEHFLATDSASSASTSYSYTESESEGST